MSPIPPNPQNSANNNENNVENNDLNENILVEEDQQQNTSNGDYQMLNQVPANNQELQNESDDDEDDDEDDDSDTEFDPDLDFEQLATTRAYIQQQQSLNKKATSNQPIIETNNNLFDNDFFERKIKLECEEIVLDENKSKKITEIMANFKLDDKFVPNWAKTVPENVWKKNLIDSLNAKKTDLFEIKSNDETNS